MNTIEKLLEKEFGISQGVYKLCKELENKVIQNFSKIDGIREYNQYKVLRAFQKHNISETHFVETTGYGYDDLGREALDAVYADVFGCEDALVRHNIIWYSKTRG